MGIIIMSLIVFWKIQMVALAGTNGLWLQWCGIVAEKNASRRRTGLRNYIMRQPALEPHLPSVRLQSPENPLHWFRWLYLWVRGNGFDSRAYPELGTWWQIRWSLRQDPERIFRKDRWLEPHLVIFISNNRNLLALLVFDKLVTFLRFDNSMLTQRGITVKDIDLSVVNKSCIALALLIQVHACGTYYLKNEMQSRYHLLYLNHNIIKAFDFYL